jgi:hypothetical protein
MGTSGSTRCCSRSSCPCSRGPALTLASFSQVCASARKETLFCGLFEGYRTDSGGSGRAATIPMLIIRHLPPLFKTVCCASRPVSSPVPCRNRFAVLVVAMRKLCAARHAMMAPAGGAKIPPSETIETSVVYSTAFWTRRTSRISSLDFSPRCFTGSFRAVDSRIVVSSWRWDSRISSALGAGQILPEDFLVNHDLISVFQVGWTVLHTGSACMLRSN